MGDVVLEGGVGVVGASSIGGGAGSPPELRLLGVKADATGSLVDLPFPVGRAELVQVSSRGAVSQEPLVRLSGDELTLRSVDIAGCAVTNNVVTASATGQDADTDLVFDDVSITGCLVDGGVVIGGDNQPASTSINSLRIEDTVFLASFRAQVALDLRGEATVDGLRLQSDVVEGGPPQVALVSVDSGTTIDTLWLTDVAFGGGEGVLVEARGIGGSVSLSNAVLATIPGEQVWALKAELGVTIAFDDSTFVGDRGDLVLVVPLLTGVVEAERSLFVGLPPRSGNTVRFSDSGFTGAPPAACDRCQTIGDPGFLRYHENLEPALWDLRFTVGSTDADCPRDASEADARGVGALRTSSARASLWYPDGDGDGLLDDWELRFLGPIRLYGADGDPDGDRLTNACEQDGKGTLPDRIDTDLDDADDRADGAPLDPDLQ
jgi:hypothetical protein